MDFDAKLNRALNGLNEGTTPSRRIVTESKNWARGILYFPYITQNEVLLQSGQIKHLLFSDRGEYTLQDFGVKGQRPPGKFEGFAVMTTTEDAPAIIDMASAELGDKLIDQATEYDKPGYEGLFTLPPDVAQDPDLLYEVENLRTANDERFDEEFMADIGFYYDRDDPDRQPMARRPQQDEEPEWDPSEPNYRDEEEESEEGEEEYGGEDEGALLEPEEGDDELDELWRDEGQAG